MRNILIFYLLLKTKNLDFNYILTTKKKNFQIFPKHKHFNKNKKNMNVVGSTLNLMDFSKRKFMYFALFVVISNFYINSANGCYITNCPWGGKRSLNMDSTHQVGLTLQIMT